MLSLYNYKLNIKSFMITRISTETRNISDISISKQIVQLLLDKGASVHCNLLGYDNIEKDITKLLPNYLFNHAEENKEIITTNTKSVKNSSTNKEEYKPNFSSNYSSSTNKEIKPTNISFYSSTTSNSSSVSQIKKCLSPISSFESYFKDEKEENESNSSSTTKTESKPTIPSNSSSANKVEVKHIFAPTYSTTTKTKSKPIISPTYSSISSNHSSIPQTKKCLSPIYISSSSTDYLTDEEANDYNDNEEEESNSSSITSNSSSSQNIENLPPIDISSSSTDSLALEEEEEEDVDQEEESNTEHPVYYSSKVPDLFINSQTTENCSIQLFPLIGNTFQIENTNLPSNNLLYPSTSITDSTISKDEVSNSSLSMNTSFSIRNASPKPIETFFSNPRKTSPQTYVNETNSANYVSKISSNSIREFFKSPSSSPSESNESNDSETNSLDRISENSSKTRIEIFKFHPISSKESIVSNDNKSISTNCFSENSSTKLINSLTPKSNTLKSPPKIDDKSHPTNSFSQNSEPIVPRLIESEDEEEACKEIKPRKLSVTEKKLLNFVLACKTGNFTTVRQLIKSGLNINQKLEVPFSFFLFLLINISFLFSFLFLCIY